MEINLLLKNIIFYIILFGTTNANAQENLIPKISGDTIMYLLTIDEIEVDFTGKEVLAMAINGSIPGPRLTFKEGQFAKIYVTNNLKEETSVHWHGLILPNYQDGVPYLNTPPILPGKSHVYEFPLKHSGTYWYHSHTGLQEQRGVYGSIVIEPRKKMQEYDYDLVLVLSDWINEKPNSVIKNLKRGNEWYSVKRKIVQSLNKTIANKALGAQLKLWGKRMPGVDISDVAFDAFLTNGEKMKNYPQFKAGDKIRLRMINASAGTYFWVTIGGKPTLMAADGIDVHPVHVKKILHAIAETYDYIITIPESGAVEIRAMAQDGSGFTTAILGKGIVTKAEVLPPPDYIQLLKDMGNMEMGGNMEEMDMKSNRDSMSMDKPMMKNDFSYDFLKAIDETTIYSELPTREVKLDLTGNMLRYLWSINDKVLSEVDKIKIHRGEKVQITLNNKTMMHHPMHLHGHFFRVINANGNYSPLKHTVNIPPMESVTIEFQADENGDWFFHCHILYHAKSGMARVFSYGDPRNSLLENYPIKTIANEDKKAYFWGEATGASHLASIELIVSNTYNQLNLEAEYGWNQNMEIALDYERYFGHYFRVYAGANVENNVENDLTKLDPTGRLGVRWLLPFFIDADISINNNLESEIGLSTSLPVFPGLMLSGQWQMQADFGFRDNLPIGVVWEQEYKWNIGTEFLLSKRWSLMASYDNRFGIGGGLSIRF